jgi:serine/threonine-protein kinase
LEILQVSSNGGTPEALTAADPEKGEVDLLLSDVLPGGKAILFSVWIGGRAWDELPIVVYSLETGERRVVVEGGTNARYVPTGHLVYVRSGVLMAAPFDLGRLEVTGAAVPVIEDVLQSSSSSLAQFSFSNGGWLVYLPGGVHLEERTLVWVDREGRAEPLPAPRRPYLSPRLSRDGQRLAVSIEGPLWDAWSYEIGRDTLTRLTFEGDSIAFVWTPDGTRLSFSSTRAGPYNMFWMPADGSGPAERLHVSENEQFPTSWSPDGRLLAFVEVHPETGADIWILSMDGEQTPHPFLVTPFNEGNAEFSPDGGWLAYESDESGQPEVYLRPYPGPGGKRQVSSGGGSDPVWAPDGRALFYRADDKMMAVPVGLTPELTVGKARLLFEGKYASGTGRDYDLSPDGRRFLMLRSEEESGPKHINVVLNWFEELERLVPTN